MTLSNDSDTVTEYICEDCGRSAMDTEDVDHDFGPHHVNRPYRYLTRSYVAVDALLAVFNPKGEGGLHAAVAHAIGVASANALPGEVS